MMLIGAACRDDRQYPPDGTVLTLTVSLGSTWLSASAPTTA